MIPFLIIDLHDVRHIGLGTSGLVVAELLENGLVGSRSQVVWSIASARARR